MRASAARSRRDTESEFFFDGVVPSSVKEVDQVLQTETTELSGLAFAVCPVGQLCFPERANPVSQSCGSVNDS
jgi:hypothetical protein